MVSNNAMKQERRLPLHTIKEAVIRVKKAEFIKKRYW